LVGVLGYAGKPAPPAVAAAVLALAALLFAVRGVAPRTDPSRARHEARDRGAQLERVEDTRALLRTSSAAAPRAGAPR
jgi:hypothetical protein